MTEPPLPPSGVRLLEARRLRLVETAAPPLPPADRAAMDRVWAEAVRANPSLFDGPVAACAGLTEEAPGSLVVTWARTTYRRYALRRVPGSTSGLPALFVGVVQPADDGSVLVGRMASSTAAPGRWQLPGGSVEPPNGDGPLDPAALRRHAAREMVEETGAGTAPEDLTRWLVTRGPNGNVGVLFVAPRRPARLLHRRYADLVASETAQGRDPEFDRIAFVRSWGESSELGGPTVDYLEPVLGRWSRSADGPSAP